MNDTMLTIAGNVVDTPKLRRTKGGHFVASFRVASTPRRFDRETNGWVDGSTLFVTVTCWRAMGENAAQSLRKGQPVVVHGRYCQREYERDEKLHTTYELEAVALGHDLARGVSRFDKVIRTLATEVAVDDEGMPADETGHYLDADEIDPAIAAEMDTEIDTEIDIETGEVRPLAPTG
jgi:single-strand DNA-binding protein